VTYPLYVNHDVASALYQIEQIDLLQGIALLMVLKTAALTTPARIVFYAGKWCYSRYQDCHNL